LNGSRATRRGPAGHARALATVAKVKRKRVTPQRVRNIHNGTGVWTPKPLRPFPMSPATTLPSTNPSMWQRHLATADRALGILLTVLSGGFAYLWLDARGGPDLHDTIFALVRAVWLAPSGPLFILAGTGMAARWRWRWVLQALPLLWLVVSAGLFLAAFH
jgi:hypothetical protein